MGTSICGMLYIMLRAREAFSYEYMESVWHSYCLPIGSILTWRVPWTEEPGRLWSTGSQRIGHNWNDLAYNTIGPGASQVAQLWRICLIMQDMPAPSLGQEDPLEKGMATHSGIFAQRIPWTEELGGLRFMGLQKSWTDLVTKQQQ